MTTHANISSIILTNTFDEWRTRTNDLIQDRNELRNSDYVKDNANFTVANGVIHISKVDGGTTLVNDNDAYIGKDLVVAFDATVGRDTLTGNLIASMNTVSGNAFVTTFTNTATLNVRTQANILSENVITSNIMTLNVEATGAKANIATLNVTSQENSIRSNIVTANITSLNVNGSWFHTANIANSNTANSWTGNAIEQYLTVTTRANIVLANIVTANVASLNVNASGAYANILTLNVNSTGARANILEANITTSNIATLNVNALGATAIIETLNVTSQANAIRANLVTANIATLNVYATGASANIRTANILALNVESTGAYANIATLNVSSQANAIRANIVTSNIATLNVNATGATAIIETLNVTSQANATKANLVTANVATLNVNAVGAVANIANVTMANSVTTNATATVLSVTSQANAAAANIISANIATLNVNAVGSSANIATANVTTLNVAATGGVANIANVTIANSVTTNAIVTTANVTTLAVNGATATANIRVANVATLNVNAPGATAIMETLNVTSQANAVKANLETANIATLNVNAVGAGANIRIANITTLNVESTGAMANIASLNVNVQANATKANIATANITTLNVNSAGSGANISTLNVFTLNVNTTGATANLINASITTANITTGNVSGTLNIVTTGSKAIINELILSNTITGYKILNGDGSFNGVEVNGNFVKKGTEVNTLDTSQLRSTVDMDNDGYFKVYRGSNAGAFRNQNASLKFASTYNVWQVAANDSVLLAPGTQYGYNTLLTTQNLDSTVTSTSTIQAATASAVKTTYDLAALGANSVMVSANSAGTLTRKNLNFITSPTVNVSVVVHASDSSNANVSFTTNTSALFTGTTNYVTKFSSERTIGNSVIFDNGTNVGIGTASPTYKLHVSGSFRSDTISVDNLLLPQNPVGTLYSGVAANPTYYIGGTGGDNDNWKIYGESSASNYINLILQAGDDHSATQESIRLRFKNEASPYTTTDVLVARTTDVAINGLLTTTGSLGVKALSPAYDLHVAGTGYASNDFRAPIFYDSADITYYADLGGTSRLKGLTVIDTITGYVSGAKFSNDSETKDDITTRTESGFYQSSSATTGEGWPLSLPPDAGWMHLLSTTHSNDSNYYAMQLAASFYSQGLYYRSTANSGSTTWNKVALYGQSHAGVLYASSFYPTAAGAATSIGMYSPAADVLAFTTASISRLRIESDGTINAGVASGTTDYTIGAYSNGNTRNAYFARVPNDAKYNYYGVSADGTTSFSVTGGGIGYFAASLSLGRSQISGGGNTKLMVGPYRSISLVSGYGGSGIYGSAINFNCTIDTSSSPNILTVLADGTSGSGAQSGASSIVSISDGSLLFYTYDTGSPLAGTRTVDLATIQRMRISSNGNVGIGTDSPSTKLEVNGTIKSTALTLTGATVNGIAYIDSNRLVSSTGITFNGTQVAIDGNLIAKAIIPSNSALPTNGMYLPATNTIGFATVSTARMTINDAGVVRIFGNLTVDGIVTAPNGISAPSSTTTVATASTINAQVVNVSGALTAASVGVGALTVSGTANFLGATVYESTTDSTSAITGSVQTKGGLGVAKAIYGGAGISGDTLTGRTSISTKILIDSDNNSFYLDPNSSSNLYTVTTQESYTDGWFRNNTSGKGLYNTAVPNHFFADGPSYWNVAGTGGTISGIVIRAAGLTSAIRGGVAANISNDVGFVDNNGTFKLRVVGGDYTLVSGSSIRAPRFEDSDNTAYYLDPAGTSVLNDVRLTGTSGPYITTRFASISDFADGTLVVTSIDASVTNGNSFVLQATGKSYSADAPFNFMIQGYLYNNTIISYSGIHLGKPGFTTAKILNYNGFLAFWWPRVSYWNSFDVTVTNAQGDERNKVTSIINAAEPASAKKVTVTMIVTAAYDKNLNAGNLYAKSFIDSDDVGYYLDPNGTSVLANITLGGGGSIANFKTSNEVVIANGGSYQGYNYFYSNKGSGVKLTGGTVNPGLQVFSTDGGAAFMSFHRQSQYAINLGLDPDNVFRIGGWSQGGTMLSLTAAGTMTLPGNLIVSASNQSGGGIILSDDGDIVDMNDGYATMRFTNGVNIYSANKGGSSAIKLASSGIITAMNYKFSNGATAGLFGGNQWAGGYDYYAGYTYVGGNHRFGFSSTDGVLDVYADGNFYATDSSHLVWHAGNAPRAGMDLGMFYNGWDLDGNTMAPNSTAFVYTKNTPYTGPTVRFAGHSGGAYDLQLNASYGNNGLMAFRVRNGDNGTWGDWRNFMPENAWVNKKYFGSDGAIYGSIFYDSNDSRFYCDPASYSTLNLMKLRGSIAAAVSSSVYYEAAIEVREYNWTGVGDDTWAQAPRIAFHWGDRVASQIGLRSDGWISILNNPGTGYENFAASSIKAYGYLSVDSWASVGGNISTSGDLYVDGFRTIGNHADINTWWIRSNGYFTWGRAHDWTQSFSLDLQRGRSGYLEDWAYFGQLSSNADKGTWVGVAFRSYINKSNVPGNIHAGTAYLGVVYDLDDTGYYLNPASTSRLNAVVCDSINKATFTNGAEYTPNDITSRITSGFYQVEKGTTAKGYPVNTDSWQHLLSLTHSNVNNYYAMQLSSPYWNNELYFRSTMGSGSTAWKKVALHGDAITSPNTAKAWVQFNGANGTRRAAYNVSSVTRNGGGDYTVNFAAAITDNAANICAVFGAGNGAFWMAGWHGTTTTTSFRFYSQRNDYTETRGGGDPDYVSAVFFA